MKQRLLKRIRQWNKDDSQSLMQIETHDFIESVRFDVEQLLNTRRGTVLINNEFGMPELTHLFNGFAMDDVEKLKYTLLTQIKQFEPRLNKLMINFDGDEEKITQLRFQVTAQLQHGHEELPLFLRVLLSENGSVSVTT